MSVPSGAGSAWDFFGLLVRRFAPRVTRPLPPLPDQPLALGALLTEAGFDDVEERESWKGAGARRASSSTSGLGSRSAPGS
ncbi:MAG: hypothetical protein M3N68_07910 [Actinomycetota bacterium]|nr:hypothetical protein [Actinomycetota bacterium]